jgi:succinyl-CoA synthetase beta subunit
MNIHEYQGKGILKSFGVAIQEGIVADTADRAVEAARELTTRTGTKWWVIKAQIHAGGRGKGGGVKLAKTLDEVKVRAAQIIGMNLITPQTGPQGKKVHKVLIAQDVYYPGANPTSEFYMSVLLNRQTGKNIIMYSTEGGMDIEEVAAKTPDKIYKEEIDPSIGLQGFQARKIAFNLGLNGTAFKEMIRFVSSLYKAYEQTDSALFEINPVLKTSDDKIIAVDAKVSLDENALFRHPDFVDMRDISEEDPTEVEAGENNLNYVKLDGNVGCMVNGAGLAMATMDIIKLAGGEPANFLDVGGTANAARVEAAFRIILTRP